MSETKIETKEILIAERTEKLVSALYLVTGLLSDREPMKKTLRETSLTLLSKTTQLKEEIVKDKICLYQEALSCVTSIKAELSVARLSGTLSHMNSSLLLQGFDSLHTVVSETVKSLLSPLGETASAHSFLASLQNAEKEESLRLLSIKNDGTLEEKGASVRVVQATSPLSIETASSRSSYQKFEERPFSEQGIKIEKKVSTGVFKARKVGRREQILGLFVKGHDMSIKDISSKIKGCSEKTIQRELNTLVFDRVIERIGEKRWSRYVVR